jgi:hypothetical protein
VIVHDAGAGIALVPRTARLRFEPRRSAGSPCHGGTDARRPYYYITTTAVPERLQR